MINKQFRLAKRPVGLPTDDVWEYREEPVAEINDGELLVQTHYISLDPAMRGWMNDTRSYMPPVGLGDVMRAGTLGQVLKSRNSAFAEGDFVNGALGVQTHSVTDGKGLMKIDPSIAPLPLYMSVLGMTGMTAYFGLLDICDPQADETVLVSGAAGAVGSVVGQIAKIKGCRTVGIAGGAEKCNMLLSEYGYDAAIDYKNEELAPALRKHCPKGIDVYFDNVGGEMLDLVLARINMKARISICGAISQYNSTSGIRGPANYLSLLVNRAKMEGFLVFDYAKQFRAAAIEMGQWMAAGKLKSKEHIVEGIETFPKTFLMLFSGENNGKLMIKV